MSLLSFSKVRDFPNMIAHLTAFLYLLIMIPPINIQLTLDSITTSLTTDRSLISVRMYFLADDDNKCTNFFLFELRYDSFKY